MARILVIEGDQNLCLAIITFLQIGGHTAECANDGERGILLAREQQYDAIFCDATLGGMDSVLTLTTLRQQVQPQHPPIVLIAAYLTETQVKHYLTLGVSEILFKPFTEAELLRKLDAVLKN